MPAPLSSSPSPETPFLQLLDEIDRKMFRHWNGQPMLETTISEIYGPETVEIARRVRAALAQMEGVQ